MWNPSVMCDTPHDHGKHSHQIIYNTPQNEQDIAGQAQVFN